jgi:hypothetical protein
MKDIKKLQESVHKHTIQTMQSLQRILLRLQVEAQEKDLTTIEKLNIENDIMKVKNLQDQLLTFAVMNEYYLLAKGVFGIKSMEL